MRITNFLRIVDENNVVVQNHIGAVVLAFRQKYFSKRKTLYRNLKFHGLKFEARFCDWLSVREVLVENEYEFLPLLLKEHQNPVVIDAGANIGTFAMTLFSNYPNARVLSFEAEPGTASVLCQNAMLNPHLSWETYNEALWSECGFVFVSDTEWSMSNSVSPGKIEGIGIPSVDLETVLNRVQGNIELMKVDIEGGEETFLAGKTRLLDIVRHLVLELHPNACNTDLLLQEIWAVFPNIYRLSRISSTKPLILATKEQLPFPIFQTQ